jgi:hypothetical protein
MAAKLTRLTHKIAIQPHPVAESCTICSSRSRRPDRKLLDTLSNNIREDLRKIVRWKVWIGFKWLSIKTIDRVRVLWKRRISWLIQWLLYSLRRSLHGVSYSVTAFILECIQKFPNWVLTKSKTIIINTRWKTRQSVMATELTRLTHKITIQLYLVAESCTICSSRSKRPVRELLNAPSYIPNTEGKAYYVDEHFHCWFLFWIFCSIFYFFQILHMNVLYCFNYFVQHVIIPNGFKNVPA